MKLNETTRKKSFAFQICIDDVTRWKTQTLGSYIRMQKFNCRRDLVRLPKNVQFVRAPLHAKRNKVCIGCRTAIQAQTCGQTHVPRTHPYRSRSTPSPPNNVWCLHCTACNVYNRTELGELYTIHNSFKQVHACAFQLTAAGDWHAAMGLRCNEDVTKSMSSLWKQTMTSRTAFIHINDVAACWMVG